MRWLLIIIGVFCALYLAACASAYKMQDQMLYYPPPVTPENQQASVAWLHDGQTLRITQVVRSGEQAIIYFGGNGEDVIDTAANLAQIFPERSIYALNYRGYSGSTGEPSEKALVSDALALFDRVYAAHPHVDVMGRSLGSGVAVQLAHAKPVERLVLVTPYDSIVSVARGHYPYLPASVLLRDKYRSVLYAPNIKIPVTLLVAGQDRLIPPAHAALLAKKFPPQQLKVITFESAGHNDISQMPGFWEQVAEAFAVP
jgi:pimeloyl-ACP methyl ester carboxylesterase